MTEAKEHTSKNEAQHTKAILIAKSPNCEIKPPTKFPKIYFWTDISLDRYIFGSQTSKLLPNLASEVI